MNRQDDREPITITAKWKHSTAKAMLVLTEDGRDVWIPISQIKSTIPVDLKENEEVELEVAAWFADKEELY